MAIYFMCGHTFFIDGKKDSLYCHRFFSTNCRIIKLSHLITDLFANKAANYQKKFNCASETLCWNEIFNQKWEILIEEMQFQSINFTLFEEYWCVNQENASSLHKNEFFFQCQRFNLCIEKCYLLPTVLFPTITTSRQPLIVAMFGLFDVTVVWITNHGRCYFL